MTWPAPVFVGAGGRRLRHVCSVDSGSEFVAGRHEVVCYPADHPAVTCHFTVHVVGTSATVHASSDRFKGLFTFTSRPIVK